MRTELTYQVTDDEGNTVFERKVAISFNDVIKEKALIAKKLGEILQFSLEKDFGLDPKPKNPYFQK